jgi:hypothetical protein
MYTGTSTTCNIESESNYSYMFRPIVTVRFLINKCYVWRTFIGISLHVPMPVAAPSKAWVCGRSHPEIAGSNPAGSMDVCLLRLMCVVRNRSLRRAEHSSTGFTPTIAYLSECDREASIMRGEGALAHYGLLRQGVGGNCMRHTER